MRALWAPWNNCSWQGQAPFDDECLRVKNQKYFSLTLISEFYAANKSLFPRKMLGPKKIWVQKMFASKKVRVQHNFGPKHVGQKKNLTQICWPNILGNSLGQKLPNLFWPKVVLDPQVFRTKIVLGPNFLWT